MAAIWTPTTTDPLMIAQEDEVNIDATVTIHADSDVEGDTVTSITWSSTLTIPAQFVFTPSYLLGVGTLLVHAPDFVDIFQIVDLQYLLDGVPGIVYHWADLPADAEDVTAFHPDPQNIKNFPLDVTAHYSISSPETKTYILRIFANYTLGKNLLVAAVDARR